MSKVPNEEDMSGIVRHCASKAYYKIKESIPFEDLVDAGHKGLNHAVKYYKEGCGAKWCTFATMSINQRIYEYITRFNKRGIKSDPYPICEDRKDNTTNEKRLVKSLATCDNVNKHNTEYLNWLIANSGLTDHYQEVLHMLLSGVSRKDVGKYKGISHERVRQIYNKSIEKMKDRHYLETLKVGA